MKAIVVDKREDEYTANLADVDESSLPEGDVMAARSGAG